MKSIALVSLLLWACAPAPAHARVTSRTITVNGGAEITVNVTFELEPWR
jgi:hypothetical protein